MEPPRAGDGEGETVMRYTYKVRDLRPGEGMVVTDMPLLPDDDTPLEPRVHALSAWCGGFLFGLSSRRGLNLKAISEEGREIVQDLTQFTQAGLSAEDHRPGQQGRKQC